MKIGILTFHYANNYGAVLQGYALQTYLSSLGHEVEVIDYRPKYLFTHYKVFYKFNQNVKSKNYSILRFFKWFFDTLWYGRKRLKYTKLFEAFNSKYIRLSKNSIKRDMDSNFDYDVYVMGSDQIWNSGITHGLDNLFWGNFKIGERSKRITYAASSSKYSFEDKEKEDIARFLPLFDRISVRESELKDYLKSEFSVNSQLVCDPTLLVDRSVWDEIAVKPTTTGYVLTYFTDSKTLELANKIAAAKGLEVVSIYNIYTFFDNIGNVYSPAEFVGAFKYADYVVSSSFHGLAFSLIFNREFCVLGSGSSRDSRVLSILDRANIEGRYITNVDDMEMSMFDSKIDYSAVNTKLEEFRAISRDFLKQSL